MARGQNASEDRKVELLERAIRVAIRGEGWLLPELEEEIARSEDVAAGEVIELPESLADPLAVLDRVLDRRQRAPREHAVDPEYQEELRRAARAGSATLPEDVEARMRRDRRAAEREADEIG